MMQQQKPPLSTNRTYYIGRWSVIPHEPLSRDNVMGKWLVDIKYSPRAAGVLQVIDHRVLTTAPGPLTLMQAVALFGVRTTRRIVVKRNPGQMSLGLAA